MKEIKYKTGDIVYWLSPKGYKRGTVKRVFYDDLLGFSLNHVYFLTCEEYPVGYRGDEVKAELVFSSSEDMLDYYANLFK